MIAQSSKSSVVIAADVQHAAKRRRSHRTDARRPSWTEKYRLGVELNREMEPFCTLEQLAAELGVSKQNAYTESVAALGKLAWLLSKHYGRPIIGATARHPCGANNVVSLRRE